jgi:nucleotide-binding universal stress UspA family protein
MIQRFLVGVDDSQNTLRALENLGTLFREGVAHFHLFHAVTQSTLPARPPTSVETADWVKVQKRQAQQVLDKAVGSLVQIRYKRSRLSKEIRLESVNIAQDILDASRKAEIRAIVMAGKERSAVKRLFSATTSAKVCKDEAVQPVWIIGGLPLSPPHILVAVDQSDYAHRTVAHLAETIGSLPETRVTLLHVMPAKPPGYWDDGHILDKSERSGREALVAQWRWRYEIIMGATFAKARGILTRAGVAEERITTRMQARVRGIARDILNEANRGGYNILAFGRRGSGSSTLNLGSRATKILESARNCTLVMVN